MKHGLVLGYKQAWVLYINNPVPLRITHL